MWSALYKWDPVLFLFAIKWGRARKFIFMGKATHGEFIKRLIRGKD